MLFFLKVKLNFFSCWLTTENLAEIQESLQGIMMIPEDLALLSIFFGKKVNKVTGKKNEIKC